MLWWSFVKSHFEITSGMKKTQAIHEQSDHRACIVKINKAQKCTMTLTAGYGPKSCTLHVFIYVNILPSHSIIPQCTQTPTTPSLYLYSENQQRQNALWSWPLCYRLFTHCQDLINIWAKKFTKLSMHREIIERIRNETKWRTDERTESSNRIVSKQQW